MSMPAVSLLYGKSAREGKKWQECLLSTYRGQQFPQEKRWEKSWRGGPTVLKEKILRGVKAWLHDVPTGMGSLAMGPQYLKAACTLGVGPKQKAIKFPNPIMSLENGNIFSFYSTVGFPDSGTTS